MKKLLVLALAVVLTLALTVAASAATFDPYVGGVFQLTYQNDDASEDKPLLLKENADRSMVKAYVTGTVKDEETNTWAKIGARLHAWSAGESYNPVFEAGIKQIGDALDIWYTNDENDKTLRGQERLYYNQPHKFGPDPIFCHRLGGGVLGFDYNSDAVAVNVAYVPTKTKTADVTNFVGDSATELNELAAAITFKFDGGKVYVGHWSGIASFDPDYNGPTESVKFEATEMIVGGEYKLGFGTIKADYLTQDVDIEGAEKREVIQANVSFDKLGFNVTLLSDDKYTFLMDGGTGYGIEYTGIENLTIGYKALTAKDEYDEGQDLTDVYVGYKWGIFNTRIGSAKMGADGDNFFYATAQVNMW